MKKTETEIKLVIHNHGKPMIYKFATVCDWQKRKYINFRRIPYAYHPTPHADAYMNLHPSSVSKVTQKAVKMTELT